MSEKSKYYIHFLTKLSSLMYGLGDSLMRALVHCLDRLGVDSTFVSSLGLIFFFFLASWLSFHLFSIKKREDQRI